MRSFAEIKYDPVWPTVKNHYDVLMDGYTYWTSIESFLDAVPVALDLARRNPHARVEIKTTRVTTELCQIRPRTA